MAVVRRRLAGLGAATVDQLIAAQIAAGTSGDVSGLLQFDIDNTADREARIAQILADPNTIPTIRALVQNPLYGRAIADYLYNNPNAPTPPGISDEDRDEYVRMLGGVWAAAKPAAPVVSTERPRGIVNGREVYLDDGSPVPGGYSAKADAERQLREQGYSHPKVADDGTVISAGPPDHPAVTHEPGVDLLDDGPLTAGIGGGWGMVLALGLLGAVLVNRRHL